MKKTFSFSSTKIKPERQVDAIKYEIKKYIARERRKKIPEGSDYWDFDCKFGDEQADSKSIHLSEINKNISSQFSAKKESFYLEILVKAVKRNPKTPKTKSNTST